MVDIANAGMSDVLHCDTLLQQGRSLVLRFGVGLPRASREPGMPNLLMANLNKVSHQPAKYFMHVGECRILSERLFCDGHAKYLGIVKINNFITRPLTDGSFRLLHMTFANQSWGLTG